MMSFHDGGCSADEVRDDSPDPRGRSLILLAEPLRFVPVPTFVGKRPSLYERTSRAAST